MLSHFSNKSRKVKAFGSEEGKVMGSKTRIEVVQRFTGSDYNFILTLRGWHFGEMLMLTWEILLQVGIFYINIGRAT